MEEPFEKLGGLTHHGKKLEQLEPNKFAAVDEQEHFTRAQVIQALCSKSVLFLQIGDPDTKGKTVTSEIEPLLRTAELVQTPEGFQSLLVDE